MRSGDVVLVKLHDGTQTDLLLANHVFPDATCGQWDEGHYAYDAAEREYFVSQNDGAVWRMPDNALVGDVVSVSAGAV